MKFLIKLESLEFDVTVNDVIGSRTSLYDVRGLGSNLKDFIAFYLIIAGRCNVFVKVFRAFVLSVFIL